MVLTDLETARAVKDLHENFILTIPGVWGVGVGVGNTSIAELAGKKEIRFSDRDGYAIKVFVHSKIEDTECEDITIPKELPDEKGRVNVDVEVEVFPTGPTLLQGGPPGINTGRFRPVVPGVSVGPPTEHTGTIGLIVKRASYTRIWPYIPGPFSPWLPFSPWIGPIQPRKVYKQPEGKFILSCQHVLGGWNQFGPGTRICQPGPWDAPCSAANEVARLTQSILLQRVNDVDCAIAALNQPSDPRILKIGKPTSIADAQYGMKVRKTGRSTDYTEGYALLTGVTLILMSPWTVLIYRNMDMYLLRTARGDSGAAICYDWGQMDEETAGTGGSSAGVTVLSLAVANLFGGYITFGCPIRRIFSALSIELV